MRAVRRRRKTGLGTRSAELKAAYVTRGEPRAGPSTTGVLYGASVHVQGDHNVTVRPIKPANFALKSVLSPLNTELR
jgi:hypothetical protein